MYCGDHDPDGLRISDTLRKNLFDVKDIFWADGSKGYDPTNLEIKRFGLNYDFIIENGYTWIDNLITGSGMNLADATHKNNKLPYVKEYLSTIGERKCEANAIVTTADKAMQLVKEEIESWIGPEAKQRFSGKRFEIQFEYSQLLDQSGLRESIETFLED